jgi:palmitoyltransferase
MKLLTNIYRARQVNAQLTPSDDPSQKDTPSVYPTRVDVYMVNYLLTEFRQHIIPRTCALIFLQGQIHRGLAHAEDFPLNLWDMERMYEGVYQYLEFFAILTECDAWKKMMADWDITCELVTLLQELNTAVPCSLLARDMEKLPPNVARQHERATNGPPLPQDITSPQPAEVPADRPYVFEEETKASGGPGMPESTLSFHQPTAAAPLATAGTHAGHEEEPSDFPWKNLKKLTVLVLSSLTWKFPKVQDQVREHGGIQVMLNCTKHDDFNPYIREHAVMALRFLIEGNDANRQVVRDLEAQIERYEATIARASNANALAAAETGQDRSGKKKPNRSAKYIPDPMPPPPLPASASSMAAASEGLSKAGLPSINLFNLMTEMMTQIPARFKDDSGMERQRADLLKALDKEFDASDGGSRMGSW